MKKGVVLLTFTLLISLLSGCLSPIVAPQTMEAISNTESSVFNGISSPAKDATVSGDVVIIGTAQTDSFQKYELAYK